MRISNSESAKKQAITKLPAFTVGAAFLFFLAAFIAFWNGPIEYQEQIKQMDWPITDATISCVDEYYEAFYFKGSGDGATLYDSHYEYVVDGTTYTGIIEEEIAPRNVGDSFPIKYNPEAPEEHTRTLEPSKSYIASGILWVTLGLIMTMITVVLIKKGRTISQRQTHRKSGGRTRS